ncbi:MAG: ATP-binding domain-containing protein [Myxococcota bacterium]
MALADGLVGDSSAGGRPGVAPRFTRVSDADGVPERVALGVSEMLTERPDAHVCVVVRRSKDAKPLAEALADLLPEHDVRHGHNASFQFDPGATVTNMRQIKGLEFDAVFVVEPSEANYSSGDGQAEQGRKWLYTVLTRAKDRLELIGLEPLTGLLSDSVEHGRLEVADEGAVPEVVCGDEDDEPF